MATVLEERMREKIEGLEDNDFVYVVCGGNEAYFGKFDENTRDGVVDRSEDTYYLSLYVGIRFESSEETFVFDRQHLLPVSTNNHKLVNIHVGTIDGIYVNEEIEDGMLEQGNHHNRDLVKELMGL